MKRREKFVVTVTRPPGVSVAEMAEYIRDTLTNGAHASCYLVPPQHTMFNRSCAPVAVRKQAEAKSEKPGYTFNHNRSSETV